MDLDDHARYEQRLQELCYEAVAETLSTASIDGVARLATRWKVPRDLGWAIGGVDDECLDPALLAWLDAETPQLRDVVTGWAARKLQGPDDTAVRATASALA